MFWKCLQSNYNVASENMTSQKGGSLPTINLQVLCEFQGWYRPKPYEKSLATLDLPWVS